QDYSSASWLFDRAVELSARPQGMMPTWWVYHGRGLVRLALGRLQDAMADLRIAVRLARAWRWSGADATRFGTEGVLEQLHADLIEAGNRLYLETGDPALIAETFEAAEENRAASLRALIHDDRSQTPDLPPAYWSTLGRLQGAEIAALRSSGRQAQEAVRS